MPKPTFLTDFSLQYNVTSLGTGAPPNVLSAALYVNGVAESSTSVQVVPTGTGAQGLEKSISPHILLEAGDVLNLNINLFSSAGTFTINPVVGVVRVIQ